MNTRAGGTGETPNSPDKMMERTAPFPGCRALLFGLLDRMAEIVV